jgi:feruloyl esterase
MAAFSHYGFATVSTDTGHLSHELDSSCALNQPESIIDWGWRAMHGSLELAKQIAAAYYGDAIQHSYYASCSTGLRQGLRSIQLFLFPEDFDGLLMGAPAFWTTYLQTWTAWIAQKKSTRNRS